jgi:hypothetical protein
MGGCRAVTFSAGGVVEGLRDDDRIAFELQMSTDCPGNQITVSEMLNIFFRHRSNLFIVELHVNEAQDKATFVYSTSLDKDDLEDFHEAGAHTSVIMQGIRGELGLTLEENLAEYRNSSQNIEARIKALWEEREADKAKEDAKAADEAQKQRWQDLGKVAEMQGWKNHLAGLKDTVRKLGGKVENE